MSLSNVIAWLSKRFPEQLTVTRLDYTQLREEVASYNVLHQNQAQIVDKLITIEKRLKNLENANGFVSTDKSNFRLER